MGMCEVCMFVRALGFDILSSVADFAGLLAAACRCTSCFSNDHCPFTALQCVPSSAQYTACFWYYLQSDHDTNLLLS